MKKNMINGRRRIKKIQKKKRNIMIYDEDLSYQENKDIDDAISQELYEHGRCSKCGTKFSTKNK